MNDNGHPITPPSELVIQWVKNWAATKDAAKSESDIRPCYEHVADEAAQWGADQELEACCEWLDDDDDRATLRAARRPKPPSLKEQALDALRDLHQLYPSSHQTVTIRHALEQLPD